MRLHENVKREEVGPSAAGCVAGTPEPTNRQDTECATVKRTIEHGTGLWQTRTTALEIRQRRRSVCPITVGRQSRDHAGGKKLTDSREPVESSFPLRVARS
jgi:hypothetical protein